jgi:large subunit ribosomal protein L10
VTLNLAQKQAVVAEVAQLARRSLSAIAAEYSGLTVAELTDLRKLARSSGVVMKVVRNTLARRALADTVFACMRDGLTGPLILAFAQDDPGAAARIARTFARGHDRLVVRMIALGGKLYDASAIDAVAALPTRERALSRLLAVMKAPVQKFVQTLAEPHAKLARTLAAIRDQKQAA